MPLVSGTRIGSFEIVSSLGAGGMGEVYRATDTNLKRQVATKVLPASFATDPGRLARFQREAEVLAALNHPNIAHVHGLETSGSTIALVMELVEGEDLSQKRGAPDIWVVDLAQGTETRLTSGQGPNTEPVWTPDSSRIVFGSAREGTMNLYVRAADGGGAEELLLKSAEQKYPLDLPPDGKWLLYVSMTAKGGDVWVLPMTGSGERKPLPYMRSDAYEDYARFSPDGRFVAYALDESGLLQLYVRPFDPSAVEQSGSGGRVRVSLTGVEGSPRWEPDGKGLTYFTADGKRWLVNVTTTPTLRVGTPRLLGQFPEANVGSTPDNQRVLAALPVGNRKPSATVILNGLKR